MKIDLTNEECLMIEYLLVDAALNSKNLSQRGAFREFKLYFSKTITEHEKNKRMRISEMKKIIGSN